ncbi:MAG TPA: copper resistance protein B [Parvularculaceae bacterium]|nr:copper resistance protein B [Parvularculaceae bacterium]
MSVRVGLALISLLSGPSLALAEGEHDARHMLSMHHGGQTYSYVEGDRLEFATGEGDPFLLWDAQGFWGGDLNKLWIKTEGAYDLESDSFGEGEVQALWSRAIGSFFDFQTGVRRDFAAGPDRTYGVIGVQGLVPYLFEIDAAAFVSGHGDVTARVELEYELLITQRLILQPRAELELSAQEAPELGLGSGVTSAELGARLRYEIRRRFAPYVGLSWERSVGGTADLARLAGEDVGETSFVAGVRFWF